MATQRVTPRESTGALPAAAALPRRTWRPVPVLAVLLLVLGGHAWLVGLVAPAAPRAGTPRVGAGVVQLRSLPLPAPAAESLPPRADAAKPRAPQRPPVRANAPAAASPAPGDVVGDVVADVVGGVVAAMQPKPGDAPAAAVATTPAPGTSTSADAAAEAGAPSTGEPPPLCPAPPPPPVQLRYALRINGHLGDALLVWQHDGQRYRLTLDGQARTGAALLAQASEGVLDGNGLAPERFVDRRRGGPQQAANFRQDIGRIGYSGPPQQHPAWPGAQDRLSWLAQLAAILAAADAPPTELRLFVTDARGNAGLWQLQRQPDTTGTTPWGDAPLQHWQREPPRPEGLRVDLWLAASAAAPAGHWPLRLRFAVPRSGDVVELQLLAPP